LRETYSLTPSDHLSNAAGENKLAVIPCLHRVRVPHLNSHTVIEFSPRHGPVSVAKEEA
jgi:hypothetical protein